MINIQGYSPVHFRAKFDKLSRLVHLRAKVIHFGGKIHKHTRLHSLVHFRAKFINCRAKFDKYTRI